MGVYRHDSVMPADVLTWLAVRTGGRYIDGTLGGGGHAERILAAAAETEVLGIDRDDEALAAAGQRLEPFGGRVHLRRGNYSEMAARAAEIGWREVDGIVLDLGISSHQIDEPGRGFSHRADGPLDMRMDRRQPVTAATLLNTATEGELARLFAEYGEERRARQVARAVVRRRQERPWARTGELAELVRAVVGRAGGGLPAPTRCFQALRIAVNRELEELEQGLTAAIRLLRPGGRLVVISFHSLEDRAVKQAFREAALRCVCPPGFPECRCEKQAWLRVLTRRPLQASAEEVAGNRRAASAKLRAAERIEPVH